ncbi:ABC transporter permease [Romboutsia sp.]|uniref:ABC transporter permease n=1 Tax=Romboutsia sp. TaxID=1965302 RepID=UPI002C704C7E|nr:ABC transporter permease [Romboutsia sp.]HSQ88412.1 ABC transporter permease [Romboutsia sp.]
MLGKLLKYELKSTARTFIPLYIAILLVSIVNGFSLSAEMFKIQGLSTMLLVGLFIALLVINIVVIVQRFKKNLLEDEGYLMFTLPVSPKMLVLSKYIVSVIWTILSGLVAMLVFMLVAFISSNGDIKILEVFNTLTQAMRDYNIWSVFLSMLILILCGYSTFIFTIYTSLSLGQLPIFNKHRIAASLVSFFVINSIISTIQNKLAMYINTSVEMINIDGVLQTTSNNGLFANIALQLVILVCLFIGTSYILENKLNLE